MLQAQYDNYWLISDQLGMEFLTDGSVSTEDLPNVLYPLTQSCINTKNGNRFYSDNGKIYNKGWDLIYTLPVDPSLLQTDPVRNILNVYSSLFLKTVDSNIYYFVSKRCAHSPYYTQIMSNVWSRYIYIYI